MTRAHELAVSNLLTPLVTICTLIVVLRRAGHTNSSPTLLALLVQPHELVARHLVNDVELFYFTCFTSTNARNRGKAPA